MRLIIWIPVLLLVAPASVCGEGSTEYLTGGGGGSIHVTQRVCTDDNLYVHHDGTFEGGVASAPGNVLAVVTGVVFEDIPIFPDGGRYDVEIPAAAAGAFTVGSWGNWPDAGQGYFWLVDQDGPEGYPWTHVAEGTGFPQGWQDPEPIWGVPIHSMGIGVHFTGGGSPAVPTTWGSVKSLFAAARSRVRPRLS
jgi:hypothetical protein